MAILIRNAYVFAPKELGVTDVLMVGEKILAVGPNLSVNLPGLSVIDATGFGAGIRGRPCPRSGRRRRQRPGFPGASHRRR